MPKLSAEQSEAIVQLIISMEVVQANIDKVEQLGLSVKTTKHKTENYKRFIHGS